MGRANGLATPCHLAHLESTLGTQILGSEIHTGVGRKLLPWLGRHKQLDVDAELQATKSRMTLEVQSVDRCLLGSAHNRYPSVDQRHKSALPKCQRLEVDKIWPIGAKARLSFPRLNT